MNGSNALKPAPVIAPPTKKEEKMAGDPKATPLQSAPPPWHSVAMITLLIAILGGTLPSLERIDEIAALETFTVRIYPEYVSLEALAQIRIFFAVVIFYTSFHVAVLSNGWVQEPSYIPGSKLIRVPNHMVGIKTMFPFTSVSWNLLGLSFALSGYIAYNVAQDPSWQPPSPWLLRTALVVWEMAAPFSMLVAAVVRYAIWPAVLRTTGDTTGLKCLRNKLMHNANVVMALTEAALFSGMPVRWSEAPYGLLVGCAYVIFSWNMTMAWNRKEFGPQFVYFFMDTTVPGFTCTYALLGLLMALLTFHGLFWAASQVLIYLGGGIEVHLAFVLIVASSVVRFRD